MKDIIRFNGISDLYCDYSGQFFYKDKPTKIVYNNGSRSVLLGKSKKGLIKLRKLAYKSKIEETATPF